MGKIAVAEAILQAEPLLDRFLERFPKAELIIAGSARRGYDLVGDLDVVLSTAGIHLAYPPHMEGWSRSVGYDGDVGHYIECGFGMVPVDVFLAPPAFLGTKLVFATGPREFNLALERLRLGVFRTPYRTEAELFADVGLPFVPPEERDAFWRVMPGR